MRLRSIGAVLLGLVLMGAGSAWAQVSTTGTIVVTVEDPQGGRLPGVAVSAQAAEPPSGSPVSPCKRGAPHLQS